MNKLRSNLLSFYFFSLSHCLLHSHDTGFHDKETTGSCFSQGRKFLCGIFRWYFYPSKQVFRNKSTKSNTPPNRHTNTQMTGFFCVTLGELHVPAFLLRLFLDSLSQGPLLPQLPTLHRGCRGDRTPRDCGFLCLLE